MTEPKQTAPISCPNANVWISLVAGTENSGAGESLTVHAATCDLCAGRLKEAMQLFTAPSEPFEDEFVASLASAQPDWQKAMAYQLSTGGGPTKSNDGIAHWVRSLAGHWPVLAALTAALLLSFAAWRYAQRQYPMGAQEVRSSASPRMAPPSSHPPVNEPPPPPKLIAAITLEPGLSRGLERIKVVKFDPSVRSLAVTLLFTDPPPDKLHLNLVGSSGDVVWTEDLKLTTRQKETARLTVMIPAGRMRSDDYEMSASDKVDQGGGSFGSYRFRVIKESTTKGIGDGK